MTKDALEYGNSLLNQINMKTQMMHAHIAQTTDISGLTDSAIETIVAAVRASHEPVIANLQAQLTALDGNYTNPKITNE